MVIFSSLKDEQLRFADFLMQFSKFNVFIRIKTIVFLLLIFLLIFNRSATAYDGVLKLTTGAEYTSGDYGGTQSVDEWYVPITARYFIDDFVFRLTVPLLSVTAPEGTITSSTGDGQVIIPGTGERTTETGVGDIIAGVTLRDVLNTEATTGTALDLTAKAKIATADEDKGLGTGENDYTLQAELYKFINQFTVFGIVGHKFRGDPPGIDLNNTTLAIVGGNYRLTPSLRAGLDFYYQQASYSGLDDQKELSVFIGYKLNDSQYLRTYLLQGYGDNSPDWGVGVMVTFRQ